MRSYRSFLPRLRRFSYVDAILWPLRVLVILLVLVGSVGTFAKGSYSAAQWYDLFTYGLTVGGVYALIALGYTMVFGVLRTINFAHGDVMMIGAFAGYFLSAFLDNTGILQQHPALSLLAIFGLSAAVCGTFAYIVERICYRPFRHIATLAPLICAIGASFVLQNGARGLFGSGTRSYPDIQSLQGQIAIGPLSMPTLQVLVIGVALATMALLYVLVQHTRLGTAIRAVSEDRDAATLMGINPGRVITLTFMLGGALAGIGGVLYCLVFNQISYSMGFLPGIKAFSAAVIGGIGNIPAAMCAGVFLGIAESLGPHLIFDGIGVPAPYQLRDVIAYGAMVIVLIFRPQGIFGERLAIKRA